MESDLSVAAPPSKPLLVFDGDCHFCTLWIRRWQQLTSPAVEYLPSQDERIAIQFPEIPRERFAASVQLIEPNGAVYHGAQAVFRSLANNPHWQWPRDIYEQHSSVARITENTYHFVATHRTLFSRLTRWFWGRHVELPDYYLTRWIFLRALGFVYFFAFLSFGMQITGLIGHNGILPADQFISGARQYFHSTNVDIEKLYQLPTLCWFNASDRFLNFQCIAGCGLSVLLIAGIAPIPCLALLWIFYLSLVTIGRDFFGFQWDSLLLEAGFLAIFFAPRQWLPRPSHETPPSRLVLWLFRFLLFKLMFSSGCVKLLSGDPVWRNLTALNFHYETQPLPTWIGWYAAQAPPGFQKFSCLAMFIIELAIPFLIFLPRLNRFGGYAALVSLQILILLTGNYAYFNLLTLALCILLLDDFLLRRWLPAKFTAVFQKAASTTRWRWPLALTLPLAVILFSMSLSQLALTLGRNSTLLAPATWLAGETAPFRIANNYGLFAVMTTVRREIEVQGSDDGTNWLTYGFKYKPGDTNQPPRFIEPLQPRLDWQMWFAALSEYQQNPWFENFCVCLLQGSPETLALLKENPFPHKPPRFIRAEFYEYHFTTLPEHRATGAWWKRERVGEYLPPVSLRE